jgi:hypothetical protein
VELQAYEQQQENSGGGWLAGLPGGGLFTGFTMLALVGMIGAGLVAVSGSGGGTTIVRRGNN